MIFLSTLRTTLCLSLCAGVLLACSSTEIPLSQHYLLATPRVSNGAIVTTTDSGTNDSIINISVTLPTYLRNMGIVLIDAGREVHVANFHFWAEPLDEGIGRLLADQFRLSNADNIEEIEITAHYLHGNTDGEVMIDASWAARLQCGEPIRARFGETTTQQSDGYTSLVEAHVGLLELLGESIIQKTSSEPTCS